MLNKRIAHGMCAATCICMLVVPAAPAKKSPLATPAYDKLMTGAGPGTNDPQSVSADKPSQQKLASKSVSIAPIALDGTDASSSAVSTTSDTTSTVLKSSVSTTDYIPKGPLDPGSNGLIVPSESIAGMMDKKKKGEISIKQAAMVNVLPIPLLQSDDETKEKVDTILDAEKKQVADLWEATLTRSRDIQFVVQKLMPTSNAPHAATILTRALSMAMFGGVGAVGCVAPNMGTMYAGQMGASMIMSVLGQVEGKAEKKARISESESVMLYNMVRNTADKMVENYRDYKRSLSSLARSNEDLTALQNMVNEARSGQDGSRQVEMEYTLRKAQRDMDEKSADLRKYRQSLQDLAGPEAVAKLDKQIQDEATSVASQTQTSVTASGQSATDVPAADVPPPTPSSDAATDSETASPGNTNPGAGRQPNAEPDNKAPNTQAATAPGSQS